MPICSLSARSHNFSGFGATCEYCRAASVYLTRHDECEMLTPIEAWETKFMNFRFVVAMAIAMPMVAVAGTSVAEAGEPVHGVVIKLGMKALRAGEPVHGVVIKLGAKASTGDKGPTDLAGQK